MLIIGAQGHAKEILQILLEESISDFLFFDNINDHQALYNRFTVLNSFSQVKTAFKSDNSFALGIGGPVKRFKMMKKFTELGGEVKSVISKSASVGLFDVSLGKGLNIMKNVFISNSVAIGDGCLMNYGCNIHHDVSIGEYCELSPQCQVLGRVRLGSFCSIGAGAIILPKIKVGHNVIIGAGAVVTKDVDDNKILVGVPAREFKDLPKITCE